ncbi:unnamed protein product [Calypogeia fissa]
MDCLTDAGRIGSSSYRHSIPYSTLMPCYMCAGTIVQFKIPTVVVGESRNFGWTKEFMESHGVQEFEISNAMMTDLLENAGLV